MMQIDWDSVLTRLRSYPRGTHNILPPCDTERITVVEPLLGRLPGPLVNMLHHFNGAELFIKSGPFVTVFGISPIVPVSELEWCRDWYIDVMAPEWRAAGGPANSLPIAVRNYGGLQILDEDSNVREWDTAIGAWSPGTLNMATWIEVILKDGDEFLNE